MDLRKKIEQRQNANREIVRTLVALVEAQPTVRFGQLLRNAGVARELVPRDPDKWANLFNEESVDTLERIKKNCP